MSEDPDQIAQPLAGEGAFDEAPAARTAPSVARLKSVRGYQHSPPPHPEACSLEQLADYARTVEPPRAVDLFCGAGGLSLGLHRAGFGVVLGVDREPTAIQTHAAHFGGASVVRDLSLGATVEEILASLKDVEVDLVAGGPPCQPFSRAGRSKIRALLETGAWSSDTRRQLWMSFVEVVRGLNPRAVLVENVPDMALGHDAIVLRRLVQRLEQLGYDVYTRILSSPDYGIPQYRQRLILVAVEAGLPFEWPETAPETPKLTDAISDLTGLPAGSREAEREYSGPLTRYQQLMRQAVGEADARKIFDHVTRDVREDDRQAYELMDSQTLYTDLPDELRRYNREGPVKFRDRYKRLDWQKPSRTITAHLARDGYWYIHPEEHRTLSVREAARIQSFPDTYRFAGAPTRMYRQIGEAVPPLLGEALGKSLQHSLKQKPGEARRATTERIALRLQGWLWNQPVADMNSPWRRGENPWQVLMGWVLFEKAPRHVVNSHWPELRQRWKSPRSFLEDNTAAMRVNLIASTWPGGRKPSARSGTLPLGEIAGYGDEPAGSNGNSRKTPVVLTRENVLETLEATAHGLCENRGYVEKLEVPGLSSERVQMAMALTGRGHRLPVFQGPVRVAERVFSEESSGGMTGQLLLARLVGVDDHGRAFAAAMEVGDRFCRPEQPDCSACPLRELCQVGQGYRTEQPVLMEIHETVEEVNVAVE